MICSAFFRNSVFSDSGVELPEEERFRDEPELVEEDAIFQDDLSSSAVNPIVEIVASSSRPEAGRLLAVW